MLSSAGAGSSPPLPLREGGDGSGGSAYAQAEFKAVDCMRVIREYVSQIDALSADDDPVLRGDLLLNIRKTDNTLHRTMLDAWRYARQEQRTKELKELQHQCTATQELARRRYSSRPDAAAAAPFVFSQLEDEHGAEARQAAYDLHQDVEFAEFFAKTRERDQEMDVALDRIHAGVLRVNDNAHGIQDELQVQEVMLKETDKKTDETMGQLASMNKKIQKAIKKLGKSRLITYVVLCVILVVLIIVIVFLAKSL